MIDFKLSKESIEWRDSVRKFVEDHVIGRSDLDNHGHFPLDLGEPILFYHEKSHGQNHAFNFTRNLSLFPSCLLLYKCSRRSMVLWSRH